MLSDRITRDGEIFKGYAFIHHQEDEILSPLIFTPDTIIGEGFSRAPLLYPVGIPGTTNYRSLPVGSIKRWIRDEHGLRVEGKIARTRDYEYMDVMRPVLFRVIDSGLVGMTYSGRKDYAEFIPGSRRILRRFPVLNISMYHIPGVPDAEELAGSA